MRNGLENKQNDDGDDDGDGGEKTMNIHDTQINTNTDLLPPNFISDRIEKRCTNGICIQFILDLILHPCGYINLVFGFLFKVVRPNKTSHFLPLDIILLLLKFGYIFQKQKSLFT